MTKQQKEILALKKELPGKRTEILIGLTHPDGTNDGDGCFMKDSHKLRNINLQEQDIKDSFNGLGSVKATHQSVELESVSSSLTPHPRGQEDKEFRSLKNYCYRARPAGFPDKDENGEDEEA